MNKTIFFLGAGFSAEAGAPSQEKLIEKIFEVSQADPYVFEDNAINEFRSFLIDTLNIPENLHSAVPFEDIFTPLDRCLSDRVSFRNLDIEQIKKKRDLVYYLVGKTLQTLLQNDSKQYIDDFARYLVEVSAERAGQYRNVDSVSVISTNWDIMLDNSIHAYIENRYTGSAVVDYCCYVSSLHEDDESIKPGLEMLGKGGFNVKLLKVHGSLNWLQCPKCLRVYVDFGEKIALNQYIYSQPCRHCLRNFNENESCKLTSNLIMPTFLKDFSNPQYKLIWQNAAVELSEAEKIVFIGYSLPHADFEMRQLLARMVRTEAKIEVVDFGKRTQKHIKDLINRYRIFFGNREVSFFLNGASQYLTRYHT